MYQTCQGFKEDVQTHKLGGHPVAPFPKEQVSHHVQVGFVLKKTVLALTEAQVKSASGKTHKKVKHFGVAVPTGNADEVEIFYPAEDDTKPYHKITSFVMVMDTSMKIHLNPAEHILGCQGKALFQHLANTTEMQQKTSVIMPAMTLSKLEKLKHPSRVKARADGDVGNMEDLAGMVSDPEELDVDAQDAQEEVLMPAIIGLSGVGLASLAGASVGNTLDGEASRVLPSVAAPTVTPPKNKKCQ